MNEESHILLSTGNVNRPYIVRDIAFATETFDSDVFNKSEDLNALLAGVKEQLKKRADEYGASAVINCHFDHCTIHTNNNWLMTKKPEENPVNRCFPLVLFFMFYPHYF